MSSPPMRFHLRLDSLAGDHVRVTVFANGGNCGKLCMRREEWDRFQTALAIGVGFIGDPVSIEVSSPPFGGHQRREIHGRG